MNREDVIKEAVEVFTEHYLPKITNEPPKIVKRTSDFGEYEELVLSDKYSVTFRFINASNLTMRYELSNQIEESRAAKDWETVNNCIYQMERAWNMKIFDGWYSDQFLELLEAYACGDYETVEQLRPNDLPLCEYGYDFYVVGSNLMRAMHYREERLFEQIAAQTEKFINGKASKWERSAIAFLYAVINGDFDAASGYLWDACKGYKRVNLGASKKFCIYAHGLYCMAMRYLSEEDFDKIVMPDIDDFDKDYALWRKANRDIKPKAYYVFPEILNLVNIAYETPLPKMKILRQEGKWGRLVIDHEAMRNSFKAELERRDKQLN